MAYHIEQVEWDASDPGGSDIDFGNGQLGTVGDISIWHTEGGRQTAQPRQPRSHGFVFDGIRCGIESGSFSAAGIVAVLLPERVTRSSKYSVKIHQTRYVNINIKVLKGVLYCQNEQQTGVGS